MNVKLILPVLLCCVSNIVQAASLEDFIEPLVEAHKGTVGVSIKNLATGEGCEINGDMPLPTASLIKFPLLIALYDDVEQGKVDLAAPITLREEDKVPGSGILTANFSPRTCDVRLRCGETDDCLLRQYSDEPHRGPGRLGRHSQDG